MLVQQTEWPLGKFVFALMVGTGYAFAGVAAIYPIYMYLH